VNAGFRRRVNELSTLVEFHAAHIGSVLQTFRERTTLRNGTDSLTRNNFKKLPLYDALNRKRGQILVSWLVS